ncbi:MAG: hypothetical protein AB7I41_14165 [Candidatus Sericytochromatia bacterium]
MKKALLLSLLSVQVALLVGCGNRNLNPNQAAISSPGAALPQTGISDPYGTGAGYGTGYGTPTTGVTDPYGTGAGYGTGTGYGTTPGYGTGTGYGTTPGYGTGTGYGTNPADPYGTGAGYGTGTGYGTGAPMIDPVTGQPIPGGMGMDPGISQQIITKIQAAGGYKALKADNVVIDFLKTLSMPIQQAFQAAPLTNRVLIVKALLDGWAGTDEVNYARQIWATVMPQDQQTLTSQDPELTKLIGKVNGSSGNGVGSVFSQIGKVFGLSK